MRPARLAMVAALGVATAVVLHVVRGFPWHLAGIAGLAVAVLGGMMLRNLDHLVRVWRPREPGAPDGSDGPDAGPDDPGARS